MSFMSFNVKIEDEEKFMEEFHKYIKGCMRGIAREEVDKLKDEFNKTAIKRMHMIVDNIDIDNILERILYDILKHKFNNLVNAPQYKDAITEAVNKRGADMYSDKSFADMYEKAMKKNVDARINKLQQIQHHMSENIVIDME